MWNESQSDSNLPFSFMFGEDCYYRYTAINSPKNDTHSLYLRIINCASIVSNRWLFTGCNSILSSFIIIYLFILLYHVIV